MQIQGAELFVKPNLVPKETSSFSYWPEVVLRALEWSCEGLTGTWLAISHTVRPWGAPSCPNQLSGVIQASLGNKRTIWLCWNHFKSKWIWTCVFQSPILFCKYLSSLKLLRNDFVFRIYRWISVLGRKKLFGNPFLGCWDISQRIKYNSNYTFFMGHPLGLFSTKYKFYNNFCLISRRINPRKIFLGNEEVINNEFSNLSYSIVFRY